MKKNKELIKIIISWILVITWMIVIFMLSNTNAKDSTNESKKIITDTIVSTTTVTNDIGLTDYHPTDNELKETVKKLNNPLREIMHSVEYLVLSILLLNALKNSNIKKIYLYTFIICIIYILSDEYHQTFVTGRTFEYIDIFMDTLGMSIGMFLYKIFKKR